MSGYIVAIVFLVVIIVALILVLVLYLTGVLGSTPKNDKSIPKTTTLRRRIRTVPMKRKIIVEKQINGMCSSDADCVSSQYCEPSRLYHLDDFDDDTSIEYNSELYPFLIELLEEQKWSINDIVEIEDRMVIATNTKNFVVQSLDGETRNIITNIIAEEFAIHQDSLLAMSNGSIFEFSLFDINSPSWKFAPTENFGPAGKIRSLNASRDGRALFVTDNEMTRVFLDGLLDDELTPARRVFGETPDDYAVFENGNAILPNEQKTYTASDGVILSTGKFLSIDKGKSIRKTKVIRDEPVFLSKRVCVAKNSGAHNIRM